MSFVSSNISWIFLFYQAAWHDHSLGHSHFSAYIVSSGLNLHPWFFLAFSSNQPANNARVIFINIRQIKLLLIIAPAIYKGPMLLCSAQHPLSTSKTWLCHQLNVFYFHTLLQLLLQKIRVMGPSLVFKMLFECCKHFCRKKSCSQQRGWKIYREC